MTNKEIIDILRLHGSLLELHGENPFKVRSYANVGFALEDVKDPLAEMSIDELERLPNVGKAIAQKISELNQTGTFKQLTEYLEKTPSGVVDMMKVNGLGVKKVRKLWTELGIEDTDQLLQACENNQIAQVKGFGKKTQDNIREALLFSKKNSQKLRLNQAEIRVEAFIDFLEKELPDFTYQITGQWRRNLEVMDLLQIIGKTDEMDVIFEKLDASPLLEKNEQTTGVFTWRGNFKENALKVEVTLTSSKKYISEVFVHSASSQHLAYQLEEKTLLQIARSQSFESEEAIYQKAKLPFIAPEFREGEQEFEKAHKGTLPDNLVELSDLKGILHAHSTYSDGKNTLEEMAVACQKEGYQYLGITDHSKSSFYANGLSEGRVLEQHQEIEELNQKLTPFKIFKGIEVDILGDGRLDYSDDFLKNFDFTIASVHSGLSMNEDKATDRLIKAVENPHTTMLGHPTGRLLLQRAGYPLQMEKVIDACAQNGVSIEINASPWRLDLDWRWVELALEKGIFLSVNPDAHSIEGIADVRFGVKVGRKGGLTPEQNVNSWDLEKIQSFFAQKN